MTYGQIVSVVFRELRMLDLDESLTFDDLKDFITIDFEKKLAIIELPFSEHKDKPIIIQLDQSIGEIK
ncbi:MAG TPA: hypothetical protein VFT71_07165 [Candidatus Nitrosocosmicus sp.]|jgi:hypothetical protein|nr:hypothetical protein [Candidatus Nitrosocosmicus sp.]